MLAVAAAALLAAAPAAAPAPANDAQDTYSALKAMYEQSCQVRAYGSYDDLCTALRRQMRDAARDQHKTPAKRKPEAVAPAAPAEPATAAIPAVAAN